MTDDEIEIINAYFNGFKGPVKIDELMRGKLINKCTKFIPNIVWSNGGSTYYIEDIIFSGGNKKAVLLIRSNCFHAIEFSKENGIWKET